MGRIGKPQKKKKNKIKRYGWYKNNDTVNQAPKNCEQEVPRKLKELGIAIKEVKSGKRDRNKFKNRPDGPSPNDTRQPIIKGSKYNLKAKKITPSTKEEWEKTKMGKQMQKMTRDATESYIDNLKPTRPLLENFKFKQKVGESTKHFMNRVERETQHIVTKSKIADRFDLSEKDQIKSMVKSKMVADKREKKKQKLKELEPQQSPGGKEKEEKKEPMDFSAFQDVVPFGEVVHAPPVLSVLPKKATSHGHDRPGLRMPELRDAFSSKSGEVVKRKKGETIKRKNLSIQQQFESDVKREQFVEAYRQLKKKRKLN